MSGYHPGAGSPLKFFGTSEITMDYTMDQSAPFLEEQQIGQTCSTGFGQSSIDHNNQPLRPWEVDMGYAQPTNQQHLSFSSQSSASSHARSSNSSNFSNFQNRASTISTDSSYSCISNQSRSHYRAQAEHLLTGYPSPLPAYSPSAADIPAPQATRKRNAPRLPAPEKDYYKTCVSRKQRARRSNTAQKYFCTICKEPFVEKADWKRHEETYQERPEEFQCDICYAKYFLDKDFVTHHVQAHGCVPCYANTRCSEKKHVQESKRKRKTRTGWGCGFCYHFSTNWKERCNHIADHFEHDHKTMADWHHSVVIYSLLQRPKVVDEWNALLQSMNRPFTGFAWDVHSTGRVEGYPDSSRFPRLQDALEYFTPNKDAAALVRKAYDLAVKSIARDGPPPVPPKDHPNDSELSLQSLTNDTESMTQFLKSIVNDDLLPTNVTQPEGDAWSDYSSSWLDFSS
ncbi:hypothetical protein HBH56_055870 [Parastagonospora nodorum]|uniref:C2H2-type domain-containing protein n=1 Tax=Phaeosphaeria nodorum (strain SN15 / ATCC MYA-4574 / FGSC 10173) TaxID=321614 RepID=A0A7U2FBV6_PHANO|nr:hypothetical protein HBH56_055870 [Parastagonospora nodorum]QRD02432.1 hypothetical protein JI435_053870 [Parastagonospora nodorum SN15]KAH3935377.1 hypothetical protein HBH54_041680 [Parastagonospora nodorum]KAH4140219.1 hypothetical protein HBH45_081430 [Parastagonospora nodorum]KAH4155558.1 hypothetical protein HBH44_135350 [Parastagonospora nodorum]